MIKLVLDMKASSVNSHCYHFNHMKPLKYTYNKNVYCTVEPLFGSNGVFP